MPPRSDVHLLTGDAIEQLQTFAADSFDVIVTDPPYELGLLGLSWDSAGIACSVPLWREALRVLKPGGHLLAFGAPRTYHRMATAIESAGFEIRDSIHWIYGSGFPHGLDIARALDRERGDREAVLCVTRFVRDARDRQGMTNAAIDAHFGLRGMAGHWTTQGLQPRVPTVKQWEKLKALLGFGDDLDPEVARLNASKGEPGEAWRARAVTGLHRKGSPAATWRTKREGCTHARPRPNERRDRPSSDDARRWQGWNTTLKPAHEPIVLARKLPNGTTAQNVRTLGVGGLNVEACAIDGDKRRWPANVILHEETARELNARAGIGESAGLPGPSRFFYVAKADRRERDAGLKGTPERNAHPTVKPIALMRHLVRLVTPPGGIVLDPFMGSGTTGIAAILEGARFVGIDREASYVAIANARIEYWEGETLAEAA